MTKCLGVLAACLLAACSSGSPVGASGTDSAAATSALVRSHSVPLATIEANASGFADLKPFGDAVGDRPIVILDEPTHGDGNVFKLKARLVEYLHREKGFDVLLIESGMFDALRLNERRVADGLTHAALAPGRLYFMYSRTADGRRVIDYVDRTQGSARPLAMMAFDIPMGGDASTRELLPMLAGFLAARGSALPASADWPAYLGVATQAVNLSASPRPTNAAIAAFQRVSDRIEGELCTAADDTTGLRRSAGSWCRTVKSVRAGQERLWGPHDLRDRTGAENAKWLLDRHFAGRKVVLWMHSFHALRGQRSAPSGPTWVNVGTRLSELYGDKVFIAHITAGRGVYDAYLAAGVAQAQRVPQLPALHPGLLEYHLMRAGGARFMPYPDAPAVRAHLARLGVFEDDFVPASPSRFGSGYDGLFFIPDLVPVLPDAVAYPAIP
jgi:erythromycin esterase